jgi:hypothetical protein
LDLPVEHQVSDHAAFIKGPHLYVAGGYNGIYDALSDVFRIDAPASTVGGALIIETVTPLLEGRGDISGITADDGDFAYISGGFTDDNKFCEPLGTVERYEFSSDTWSNLPPLINARGEIALVELDDRLFSLGGERPIEGMCELLGELSVSELTVGTELVESYADGAEGWSIAASFPNHRFRFAAVAYTGGTELIYTFGGQTDYDDACGCFKTTDIVGILGESIGSSAGTFSLTAGFVASFLIWAIL